MEALIGFAAGLSQIIEYTKASNFFVGFLLLYFIGGVGMMLYRTLRDAPDGPVDDGMLVMCYVRKVTNRETHATRFEVCNDTDAGSIAVILARDNKGMPEGKVFPKQLQATINVSQAEKLVEMMGPDSQVAVAIARHLRQSLSSELGYVPHRTHHPHPSTKDTAAISGLLNQYLLPSVVEAMGQNKSN